MPDRRSVARTRAGVPAHRALAACLLVLSLAACQSLPEPPPAAVTPGAPAREAIDENVVRYALRPELSDVRFLVFKAGALARLGHNHVVTAKNLRGEIQLARDIHRSHFSLEMTVADFQVDEESARQDEGADFFPQPDAEAVRGTRKNMLGEQVLDAARYPSILIDSVALSGPAWGMDIRVRIRLHGVDREILIPAAVENGADRLVVTAFFSIKQTDFGITPMSVLGGALQVEDAVRVRLRLVATRTDSAGR